MGIASSCIHGNSVKDSRKTGKNRQSCSRHSKTGIRTSFETSKQVNRHSKSKKDTIDVTPSNLPVKGDFCGLPFDVTEHEDIFNYSIDVPQLLDKEDTDNKPTLYCCKDVVEASVIHSTLEGFAGWEVYIRGLGTGQVLKSIEIGKYLVQVSLIL